MVERLPIPHLPVLANIVDIMDQHSRRIFEVKKAALQGIHDSCKLEGNLEARMKGKDIMSILRKCGETGAQLVCSWVRQ